MGEGRTEAQRANVFVRQARYRDALKAYQHAVEMETSFAEGHLACAELAHLMRDEPSSEDHLRRALSIKRVFLDPMPMENRLPVVLLLRDAPYNVNTPLEMILDRSRVAVHKVYVEGSVSPPPGVGFCAFGYALSARNAIARVAELAPNCINSPLHLERCARERLSETLADVDGVSVVETTRVAGEVLANVELPALVRPADTHAGEGLLLARDQSALEWHHQRWKATGYHVSRFVNYASEDGAYRKYRLVLVDGVLYPYHLAIAQKWMVHYRTSEMSQHAWMREEEAQFLADPRATFPKWDDIAAAFTERIGLDYVGFDVAKLADGTMLVFEADPAMLIHDEDEKGDFAYKRPYVATVREALHALLGKHATL
jgi:hypothetical protein